MKCMGLVYVLAMFVVPAASAAQVDVGGTPIGIPAPAGFVATTPKMGKLDTYLKNAAPSTNEELVAFIAQDKVSSALHGGVPVARYFSVQAPKCCLDHTISDAWFSQLVRHVETKHKQTVQAVEKKLPKLMHGIEANVSKAKGVNIALSNVQLIPLPIGYTNKHAIAYSMIVKVHVGLPHGKSSIGVKVVTATIIHVKDKAIILYAFADQHELAWSKAASKTWAAAVIAAND